MKIYNSLSDHYDTFIPAGSVTLYTCGITPYDTTHIGHAFTYAVTDVLVRYLEYAGFPVVYVQNVTDIDDDILKKAKEVGESWITLGNRWTRHFIRDMKALNMRPPDYFPRATDVIPEIIETVGSLIAKGMAYESNGNVYYDLDKYPEFGQLSQIPKEEMLSIANERGNNPDDPNKKSPLDFVLWQAKAEGEPAWKSPWGMGRPGWHIECSTMINKLLGETIDIHIGGSDLEFPHHECEIAQMEPVTGKSPFVRNWMHVAMVRYQGEKMSKSLGNLIMVNDLLKDHQPDTIRICLSLHHYRETWEYTEADLEKAKKLNTRFEQALETMGGDGAVLDAQGVELNFRTAMDDDLQTPKAIDLLADLADEIVEGAQKEMNIQKAQETLRCCGSVLGLRFDAKDPAAEIEAGWDTHLLRFPE